MLKMLSNTSSREQIILNFDISLATSAEQMDVFILVFEKAKSLIKEDSEILDLGAGTGMVGIQLINDGPKLIDAYDASQKMLDQIPEGIYRSKHQGFDASELNRRYDLVVACGVIGTHIDAHMLELLFPKLLKHKGNLVFSIKNSQHEEDEFQQLYKRLNENGWDVSFLGKHTPLMTDLPEVVHSFVRICRKESISNKATNAG